MPARLAAVSSLGMEALLSVIMSSHGFAGVSLAASALATAADALG
jgi:hypothetical protein